ncbi:baculoviral IAP repeat-containing protein 7 [Periophthalmus magnuspinnatus]|uniref:baculoviral IAP repeat-containing protein 7 n=1 Tax=Periophthalmus magnuspinnatus TaxID=409849 RepID=UPI0024370A46|nr:baculoviral IAP repeat-containing protein 7 [Periophthalmus magnuspinnatus]
MTGRGQKGIEHSIFANIMDDRGTMLYLLEKPQMRRERDRLQTFQTWPLDAPVRSTDLAKAGFFYLGPGDEVQCFCCGGILRCWVHGDSPVTEHKRHFPTCNFILGRTVGNIPLQDGSSDSVDGQLLSQLQRMTMDDQGTMGQAVYPEMDEEDTRLTTFHNWPTEASVQPDVLARAGFFYTGHGDNVKCFFCDGGLRNWEPGDDPWQEHAKWFPRCEFLIQSRGQGYISNIQDAHFHLGETVSGQNSAARDPGSRNDVVGGMGVSSIMLSPVAEEEDRQRGPTSREPEVRQGTSSGNTRSQTANKEKVKDPSPEELLKQLQEERTCKVCMDKLVSIVFIPCGHLVVCGDCAASLRHCPICRAVIRGSVRAFMS